MPVHPFSLRSIRCQLGILLLKYAFLMRHPLLHQLSEFIFVLPFSVSFLVLSTQDCFLHGNFIYFHTWVFFSLLVLH